MPLATHAIYEQGEKHTQVKPHSRYVRCTMVVHGPMQRGEAAFAEAYTDTGTKTIVEKLLTKTSSGDFFFCV